MELSAKEKYVKRVEELFDSQYAEYVTGWQCEIMFGDDEKEDVVRTEESYIRYLNQLNTKFSIQKKQMKKMKKRETKKVRRREKKKNVKKVEQEKLEKKDVVQPTIETSTVKKLTTSIPSNNRPKEAEDLNDEGILLPNGENLSTWWPTVGTEKQKFEAMEVCYKLCGKIAPWTVSRENGDHPSESILPIVPEAFKKKKTKPKIINPRGFICNNTSDSVKKEMLEFLVHTTAKSAKSPDDHVLVNTNRRYKDMPAVYMTGKLYCYLELPNKIDYGIFWPMGSFVRQDEYMGNNERMFHNILMVEENGETVIPVGDNGIPVIKNWPSVYRPIKDWGTHNPDMPYKTKDGREVLWKFTLFEHLTGKNPPNVEDHFRKQGKNKKMIGDQGLKYDVYDDGDTNGADTGGGTFGFDGSRTRVYKKTPKQAFIKEVVINQPHIALRAKDYLIYEDESPAHIAKLKAMYFS
jgi:hypothetical protein